MGHELTQFVYIVSASGALPERFAVFGIRDRGGVIRWAALHRGRQLNCAAGEAMSLYDFISPLQ